MDVNIWHTANCIFNFWSIISGALDLHNNAAKIIGIRKAWDNYLIIKPLTKIAGVTRELTSDESYKVMSKLYYPEINSLQDKHYAELFWNKVYYFWVFFEHTVIAFITVLAISVAKLTNLFSVTGSLNNLWLWILFLVVFNVLIFILSVKPRTESQVRQIPDTNIKNFFKKSNIS